MTEWLVGGPSVSITSQPFHRPHSKQSAALSCRHPPSTSHLLLTVSNRQLLNPIHRKLQHRARQRAQSNSPGRFTVLLYHTVYTAWRQTLIRQQPATQRRILQPVCLSINTWPYRNITVTL